MSDYERHKGKIIKLDVSVEDFLTKIENENNIPEYYNSTLEFVRYKFNEQFFVSEQNVYEITDNYVKDDEDIFEFEEKETGIDYLFRFYNGGSSLYENIERVIDKIENQSF